LPSFVYYDIDDNIEANVIVPLAQLFVTSGWDILPVLKKLFKSEHFYDMPNRGVYIKSPFDLIIGTMRTFNASHNIADASNHELQYEVWNQFNWGLSEMEQRMGSIPTVSGWQAYYQKPSFHEYWINSNSLQKRFGYINYLFGGIEIEKNNIKTKVEVDLIKFVEQFPSNIIEDPDLLINECVKYLLPVDVLDDFKTRIKVRSLLPNDQTPNYYWTGSWLAYKGAPLDMIKKEEVRNRLKSLVIGLLQLAEYQLM
jgi:Protein of unknown function (DUF1800)